MNPGPAGAAKRRAAIPSSSSFSPDTLGTDEAYVCFGYDSAAFEDETVAAVRWSIPDDFPAGPIVCDAMPDAAVGLHGWSIGGDDLELPSGAGLLLPVGTRRFVVEAHTVRGTGVGGEAGRGRICKGPREPAHPAALMGLGAPVPARSTCCRDPEPKTRLCNAVFIGWPASSAVCL